MKETAGARTGGGQARTGEDRRGQARTGEDRRGRAGTGGDGRRRAETTETAAETETETGTAADSGGRWAVDSGGRWKQKNKKCTIQKRPRNRFRSLLSSAFRPSGAASGILPYSAGCSAGVSAGACAGISAWGIVAGASVSRTRS